MSEIQNPYHSRKLLSPYHLKNALTILREEIPAPSTIEIDLTDHGCNQGCIHCCFGSHPSKPIRYSDPDVLLPFLKEAYSYGTRAFELVGGGEPTNHPQIEGVIRAIKRIGEKEGEQTHVGLVTNGVRLEKVFPVAGELDWVRVSLDASDPITYATLHGISVQASHYEKVLRNVSKLHEFTEAENIRLGYLVVPPYNHHSKMILKAAEIASILNVKHLAFRPAFLNADLQEEHWAEATEVIKGLKSSYVAGFILGGEQGSWDYVSAAKPHPQGVCHTRPLVLVVKADGVVPSCILYRERLDERPEIGNIRDGFANLWFSEKHRKSIEAVDRRECPGVCKHYRADDALVELKSVLDQTDTVPKGPSRSELDNPYFI